MKLCKDCKHSVWPNPYSNAHLHPPFYVFPMCGHPSAPREPVSGGLTATCEAARGHGEYLIERVDMLACGPDAKLFEAPAPPPNQIVRVEAPEPRKGWIARIMGR